MCLYSIATKYNESLEAAHAHIDDDRYDMVNCGAVCQPTLDLSDRPRGCDIISTTTIRLGSADMIVQYSHQV